MTREWTNVLADTLRWIPAIAISWLLTGVWGGALHAGQDASSAFVEALNQLPTIGSDGWADTVILRSRLLPTAESQATWLVDRAVERGTALNDDERAKLSQRIDGLPLVAEFASVTKARIPAAPPRRDTDNRTAEAGGSTGRTTGGSSGRNTGGSGLPTADIEAARGRRQTKLAAEMSALQNTAVPEDMLRAMQRVKAEEAGVTAPPLSQADLDLALGGQTALFLETLEVSSGEVCAVAIRRLKANDKNDDPYVLFATKGSDQEITAWLKNEVISAGGERAALNDVLQRKNAIMAVDAVEREAGILRTLGVINDSQILVTPTLQALGRDKKWPKRVVELWLRSRGSDDSLGIVRSPKGVSADLAVSKWKSYVMLYSRG